MERRGDYSQLALTGLLASSVGGVEVDSHVASAGDAVFLWNKRECRGNRLHAAVLEEDVMAVKKALDEQPGTLQSRFHYETKFAGNVQEGSGEAIHLAVSRTSVEVVQLLIERRAALEAMVTRGGKGHYDVLHAAIFSEGRGGEHRIIRCLLDARAEPTRNLDGHYPLHKAYQIGVVGAIPMLRDDMEARGLLEGVESNLGGPVPTPLQVGIQTGKLTGEQVAQVASLTAVSLKIFLHDDPHSIPSFFERMKREDVVISGSRLAEYVGVAELCKCIREHPAAAEVLLDTLTQQPEVENLGWHPLPTRMDFGPRNRVQRFRNMFNPAPVMYSTYKPTKRWEYDAQEFKAPDWHATITGSYGRPVYDVSMEVCYLPEIISAEFLGSLQDADYDPIYSNKVVISVMECIWWGGAYRVDVLQLLLTMCGLLFLIMERSVAEFSGRDQAGERFLNDMTRTRHNPGGDEDAQEIWVADRWAPVLVDEFIGARGFVDFTNEVLQIAGLCKIGRGQEYFTTANIFDMLRAGLAVTFYWCEQNHGVQVLLIFVYWFRLLEISFSETLMRELLPIMQLTRGLAPSCAVCTVAVCAFTHGLWVMDCQPLWPDTIYNSFTLLLTAALPPESSSDFMLVFAYITVGLFTIFFLNIFIGVIGENYAIEKEASATSYQKKRSTLCFTFVLRATVLPCRLMSQRVTDAAWWVAGALALSAMFAASPTREPFPGACVSLFVACQYLTMLACYQDLSGIWAPPQAEGGAPGGRYVWIAAINAPEPPTPQDRIETALEALREEVRTMRAEMKVAPSNPQPHG